MIISPFTPLRFSKYSGDAIESRYVQTFAQTDRILIEVLDSRPNALDKLSIKGDEYSSDLLMSAVRMGESYLYFAEVTALPVGYYTIQIGQYESQPFMVTDNDEELANTTLIQYSMTDNRQRQDAVFIISHMRRFFDFRVPGGFKDSGWNFSVDNEQFITPDADPIELYAIESTQKKFTMGGPQGVSVWFAEMLNRILTCSYVYFNGERYARKGSAVPEMNIQVEGLDSFVFTQQLQRVYNIDPGVESFNYSQMRRIDSNTLRIISQQSSQFRKLK